MLPKISLLVVTYLESNQKYLDLCLKSILNLNYPKECIDVLVVSSGAYEPTTMGFRAMHSDERLHYPSGVNYGVKHLDKDSKHILLLNDDVILHKDCLLNMVRVAGEHEVIINPVSNCDQDWAFRFPIGFVRNGVYTDLPKRFYRYEDTAHIAEHIMNDMYIRPTGIIFRKFICFYCTLIPRKVWDKVGGLDDKFLTGCDDLDYSLRCKQYNIPAVIEESAFCLHHGGTTADQTLTTDIRNYNEKYFFEKWGKWPAAFH